MVAQQVFAIVSDGIIRNTIVCDNYQLANDLAKGGYGNEAFAVDCLQYPCQIDDKYIDGIFYRADGSIIERVPTAEEEILYLKQQNENLTIVLADMLGGAYNAQ